MKSSLIIEPHIILEIKTISKNILLKIKELDSIDICSIFANDEKQSLECLMTFYKNTDNQNIIKEYISSFEAENIFEYIDSHFSAFNTDETKEYTLFKKFLLLFCKYIIVKSVLHNAVKCETINADTSSKLLIKASKHHVYYRGQSNAKYTVSPSIIRNLKKDIVLNDNAIIYLLRESKLEEKYNNIFRRDYSLNAYEKLSFLQHNVCYSPFIDFTKYPLIATSFALSNSRNINDFMGNKACVFEIKIHGENSEFTKIIESSREARHFVKSKMNLKLLNEEIVIGKKYGIDLLDINGLKIGTYIFDCSSIKKMIYDLIPSYVIIDCPTNDKMYYQKGMFLCFNNCVVIKGRVFYELNKDVEFIKYVINPKTKRSILNEIYSKHREYDPEHLLNPGLYFNE